MSEINKVIEILNKAKTIIEKWGPMFEQYNTPAGIDDAITLLKEQEPAMPTWRQGKAYCGKCGQRLPRKRADREINYCGYCGQAVKWDG